jgi:hypothetical protein
VFEAAHGARGRHGSGSDVGFVAGAGHGSGAGRRGRLPPGLAGAWVRGRPGGQAVALHSDILGGERLL